jgi:dTDP-4-dehydrorhamnose 3,5-epimerase
VLISGIQIDYDGTMIDGVVCEARPRISDDRGAVWHMLKRTDSVFEEFGEIYFSTVYPGVIKGWHQHTLMSLNYCCLVGMVKVVLFDSRPNSSTHGEVNEFFLGDFNYCLLHIPKGITQGVQGLGSVMAILANCATLPHDPTEILRIPLTTPDIPYDWTDKRA